MTTDAPRPTAAPTRRRRQHRAPATRVLAAGLSASATVALVSAMAATAPPDDETTVPAASPWPISHLEVLPAATGPSPAQRVIRIEIHRKVYAPDSDLSAGSVSSRADGTGTLSAGGTSSSSRTPSRTSRSHAS